MHGRPDDYQYNYSTSLVNFTIGRERLVAINEHEAYYHFFSFFSYFYKCNKITLILTPRDFPVVSFIQQTNYFNVQSDPLIKIPNG